MNGIHKTIRKPIAPPTRCHDSNKYSRKEKHKKGY